MQSSQQEQPRDPPQHGSDAAGGVPASLLDDLGRLGRGVKELFSAQLSLLGAEWGLARSAVSLVLMMALAATVAGVGLGLTLLGLIGVALAQWFGSWIWALAALAGLQALFLFLALWMFRKGMHWMSFPASRGEWHAMMRDTLRKARKQIDVQEETRP